MVENYISDAVYVRPKYPSLTDPRTYRAHSKNSSIQELVLFCKLPKRNVYKGTDRS